MDNPFSFVVAHDAIAQRDAFASRGTSGSPAPVRITSREWGHLDAGRAGLPTSAGANFSMSGLPTMAWQEERRKGLVFSGVNLSSHTTVYGGVNGEFGVDGWGCLTSAETAAYRAVCRISRTGLWNGQASSYFRKSAARRLP